MGEVWIMEAYILAKVSRQTEFSGYGRSIVEKLTTMKGVEYTELLFGDYDIIMKLTATKIHDIENLVIEEIAMVKGIESSTTLLCVDEAILE
jgi:DNA-binding Lrp family transcriptional regulator